ncbi:hypothetical protein MPSI1_002540 [Malassezia psittaci]|uniref:Uncharacterized protein n=1 Tax=Malassezia psittaci TaxID=1821823 RepID=A0AAF0JES4_9BASI|nr:hypothetical protein MPSI1_002540 [Malassezia psittaci]
MDHGAPSAMVTPPEGTLIRMQGQEDSVLSLPELVLTPPEPNAQAWVNANELNTDSHTRSLDMLPGRSQDETPDRNSNRSPDRSQGLNAASQSQRSFHRRNDSNGTMAQPTKSLSLPSIPQGASLDEAEGALAKIQRLERIQASKSAWKKWSGIRLARDATSYVQICNANGEVQPTEEDCLIEKMQGSLGFAEIPTGLAVVSSEEHLTQSSASSSGTPSLMQSNTPPRSNTPSLAQTPSSTIQIPGSEYAPCYLNLSDASNQAKPPNSANWSREFLSNEWDQDTSSSESDSNNDPATEDARSDESYDSNQDAQADSIPTRLNLSHAEVMTNKQMRRRMRAMRKMHYANHANADHVDEGTLNPHAIRQNVVHKLKYASKAERTQRAMAKYTPALLGDTSEADERNTPTPSVSATDLSDVEQRSSTGLNDQAPSSSVGLKDDKLPHLWKRRQRRAWNNAPCAMDMAQVDEESWEPTCKDYAMALDNIKDAQNDACKTALLPKGYKTELVYDMLYENQRGAVLFGVAKRFSSHMLFVGDPSPWTDAKGANTALTIQTMQLPDPTWEWVHPTWLVDMTCDSDEDGWQYSGSFTGLQFWKRPVHFANARGPNSWLQKMYMYAQHRSEKNDAKREHQKATRRDEGIVAIMRSAQSRSLRWHGRASSLTFVRRRRWVRLRRRIVPLAQEEGQATTQLPAHLAFVPPTDMDDFEQSDESDDETQEDIWQARYAQQQTDLPPDSGASSKRNVCYLRHMYQVYQVKHFMFMLFPLFIMPETHAQELMRKRNPVPLYESEAWRRQVTLIFDQELRVQNPFAELKSVQQWLSRDDMAFVTSRIRAHERRYQRRCHACEQICPLPRVIHTEEAFDTCLPPRVDPAVALCVTGSISLIREAVVELNFSLITSVLKLCRMDRLKLNLWYVWLGERNVSDLVAGGEREVGGPIAAVQHEWNRHAMRVHCNAAKSNAFQGAIERSLRACIRDHMATSPHILDVWDVLIAHLHEVMAMLDHERSRRTLLHLIEKLQSTDFTLPAAPNEIDSRWRVRDRNLGRLPELPALRRVDT